MKPLAHQLLAEHENHRQHDDRFNQRDPQQHRQFFWRLGERGYEYQQGHHRQILKEQDAHHFTPVG